MGTRAFVAWGTPRQFDERTAIHLQFDGSPVTVGPWLWPMRDGSPENVEARARFRRHKFREGGFIGPDPRQYEYAYLIDMKSRKLAVIASIETGVSIHSPKFNPHALRFAWSRPR